MDKAALCLAVLVVATAAHSSLRRQLTVYTPPGNDLFAHRYPLPTPGPSASMTRGTLLFATGEAGEPSPTLYSTVASIWYEWTSSITGLARVVAFYSSANITEVRCGAERLFIVTRCAGT